MDFKDNQAIYLQIADLVCDYVITQKWKSGERIPSVRELGMQLEVNPNTVMRAYECLQNEDIIYNKRGVGFFVQEEAAAKIAQVRRSAFMESELPEVFRRMEVLQVSMEELQKEYEKFRKGTHT